MNTCIEQISFSWDSTKHQRIYFPHFGIKESKKFPKNGKKFEENEEK
jgi:hypothetical protein